MKKVIFLAMLLLSIGAIAQKQQYGTWMYVGRGGLNSAKPYFKYVQGATVYIKASDVNPAAGVYNWTTTDAGLQNLTDSGIHIKLEFYVGPDCPTWLYSEPYNVPNFTNARGTYPEYRNANYITWNYGFIDAFVTHILALPTAVKNNIMIVRSCEGSTGDVDYAKTPIDPAFVMDDATWDTYRKNLISYLRTKLSGTGIRLMINPGNNGENHAYMIANHDWGKDGQGTHDIGENLEIFDVRIGQADILITRADSSILRKGGELAITDAWWFAGFRMIIYCLAQSNVVRGNDMLEIAKNELDSLRGDTTIINFFNRQAGSKDPVKSRYGFCAIGGRIDATDTVLYPTGIYGAVYTSAIDTSVNYNDIVKKANTTRIAAIAAAEGAMVDLATFGPSAPVSATAQRTQDKLYNDVGVGVVTNYHSYITPVNAAATTKKLFRIGNVYNDVHGRYAGQFIMTGGHGEMFFDVDQALNSPVSPKKTVVLSVTYKDDGTGSFKVNCWRCSKKATTVTKTNTGNWLTAYITLPSFNFNGKLAGGSDISLESVGGVNTIFDMIELKITNK